MAHRLALPLVLMFLLLAIHVPPSECRFGSFLRGMVRGMKMFHHHSDNRRSLEETDKENSLFERELARELIDDELKQIQRGISQEAKELSDNENEEREHQVQPTELSSAEKPQKLKKSLKPHVDHSALKISITDDHK